MSQKNHLPQCYSILSHRGQWVVLFDSSFRLPNKENAFVPKNVASRVFKETFGFLVPHIELYRVHILLQFSLLIALFNFTSSCSFFERFLSFHVLLSFLSYFVVLAITTASFHCQCFCDKNTICRLCFIK